MHSSTRLVDMNMRVCPIYMNATLFLTGVDKRSNQEFTIVYRSFFVLLSNAPPLRCFPCLL